MSTKTVAWILAVALGAAPAFAQESRGTITGRVIDSSGAVVAGADVRVKNTETGAVVAAKTNDSGNYNVPYLVPGIYDMAAEAPGFKTTNRPGIQVRVSDVLTVELKLEVGNTSESVEVTGGAPLLEASNVSLGQVIEQRQIENLPIQAGNANELVLLTPGVTNSTNLRQRKSSFNSASSQFTTNGNALYWSGP